MQEAPADKYREISTDSWADKYREISQSGEDIWDYKEVPVLPLVVGTVTTACNN